MNRQLLKIYVLIFFTSEEVLFSSLRKQLTVNCNFILKIKIIKVVTSLNMGLMNNSLPTKFYIPSKNFAHISELFFFNLCLLISGFLHIFFFT